MGISLKTVYNEWNRGRYQHTLPDLSNEYRYSAELAQEKHDKYVSARGTVPKILKDKKLAKCIETIIADDGLSPEAALARMKAQGLATDLKHQSDAKTIYNSIDKGFFNRLTNKDLPDKKKQKEEEK